MYILLVLFSFFPINLNKTGVRDPKKAMVYSAILPAGGQFYNRDYVKGIALGGLEVFLLASACVNYRESLKYPDISEYKDFYARESFSYTLYFLGTYLFSIADAYVSAHFYNVDEYFKKRCKGGYERNRQALCGKPGTG